MRNSSFVQNTQNIPRDPAIKNLIVPLRPGEKLLEGDLSQAEGMVVAWKAEEHVLMDKYRNGEDVHSFVGSLIMGRTITKANKIERHVSKKIVHLSNYKGSKKIMSEALLNEADIVITPNECQHKQNIYFQNFPRIRSVYHAEIERELRECLRTITTPDGWTRKFFNPWGDDLVRQACAHYPQHTVANITNTGLIRLTKWGWGEYLYSQNHDAILMTVPKDKIKYAAQALKNALTQEIIIKGNSLTIPVDISVGDRWGEMKDG